MNFENKKSNIIRGGLIYTAGDTIAALLQDEFSWIRVLGILFIGATVYAFEIPNWFKWIDEKTHHLSGVKLSLTKTSLAILYFNPLWIARHLFIIMLISQKTELISWDLFRIASISFLVNIPISFIANFIIQNVVKLDWRFLASAIFSALMAIYYALSATWFA